MSQTESDLVYTVDEYLAFERQSEKRHEFLDGHIYPMAGEAGEHADICTNLIAVLCNQLHDTRCRVRSIATKVRSGPDPQHRRPIKGMFSYPDLVVICGEPQYHDRHRDVALNPTVIIEVLSESTEAFDRGEKFLRFQTWNPTLGDYVLVRQTSPIIEHYLRQPDGGWSYYVHQGMDAKVTIESIGCTLRLVEVYDRIDFPPGEEESSEEEDLV